MIEQWTDMKFWETGEYQVIKENLDDLRKAGHVICRLRKDLFTALEATPYAETRVCIIGQDPYPKPKHAMGLAFSIPEGEKDFPPTLMNIFRELGSDLKYPWPITGNLGAWATQGVLLWNSVPVCRAGIPGSCAWPEWDYLNKEIVLELNERGIVFVLMGAKARRLAEHVDLDRCSLLECSHPSPLGAAKTVSPFIGSRLFSRINAELCKGGMHPIDWKLPHGKS